MKKSIAFLLCLASVFTFSACNWSDLGEFTPPFFTQDMTKATTPPETNAPDQLSTPPTVYTNYNRVLDLYRKVTEICRTYEDTKDADERYAAELGISDESEKEILSKLLTSAYLYYSGRGEEDSVSPHYKASYGYAIKDLNHDGKDELVLLTEDYRVLAIFSKSTGKDVLLGSYMPRHSCWIDGRGLLHVCGSGGADVSSHAVYQIAMGGAALEPIVAFGTSGHEWIDNTPVLKYYKTESGHEIEIDKTEYDTLQNQYGTYLGSLAGPSVTKDHSGLCFTPLFTDSGIALQMYEAAINDEISVVSNHDGEIKLKDYPINEHSLKENLIGGRAILDLDSDGIREYVIQTTSNDTLVMHYHDKKVYAYGFSYRNLYNLCTDGTFSWNDSTYEGHEYGKDRISFDGAELKIKPVYRIVNDGMPDAQYYLMDKPVTAEKITSYIKRNQKTHVKFYDFFAPWQKRITEEEALAIAARYWGIQSGDVDEETGFRYMLILSYTSAECYHVKLAWRVEEHHYSTLEIIEIDALTGEIYNPRLDGKG